MLNTNSIREQFRKEREASKITGFDYIILLGLFVGSAGVIGLLVRGACILIVNIHHLKGGSICF